MNKPSNFKVIAFALLLLAGNVTVLSAQSRDSILREAQVGGWMLRVHTASDVTEGRILGIHGDMLVVTQTRISAADISQIERRIRGSGGWKKGLVVGALGGAAAFGLLASFYCESCDLADHASSISIGAVLGAGMGALVGEVAAPRPYKWILLWPK
jgi:hypothetical protein